jgi:hypothetical protein
MSRQVLAGFLLNVTVQMIFPETYLIINDNNVRGSEWN